VVIDTATHQTTDTGNLNIGRRQHNLTILADGRVLVTGGNTDGARLVSATAATFIPEIWDPQTGRFDTLNPMAADRQYHSIALLLADGRVLSGGGGICGDCFDIGYEERNAATFTPPYLYDDTGELAVRPVLQGMPGIADYGDLVTAETSSTITRAHLIKLGSVTHSENQDQRLVPIAMSQSGSTLNFPMPTSRNVAPPGHYLLFALDANGVPSVGAMIKLGQPLVEPGQLLKSTLEPNVFDQFSMPTSGGDLQVTVTADQPIALYLSLDRAVDSATLANASCRADLPDQRQQSCTVSSSGPGNWYVSVTGSDRTDYQLESVGDSALEDAPVGSPVITNNGPDGRSVPVTSGGSGGGTLSVQLLLLMLSTIALRYIRRPSARRV